MAQTCIGAQMYTVREFTKTPADIAQSVKKLKAIGYDAVQASALGPIEPAELRAVVGRNELPCVHGDFGGCGVELRFILGLESGALGGRDEFGNFVSLGELVEGLDFLD